MGIFLFSPQKPTNTPPPKETKKNLDDDEMDALARLLGNPCAGKKVTDTLPEFIREDTMNNILEQ